MFWEGEKRGKHEVKTSNVKTPFITYINNEDTLKDVYIGLYHHKTLSMNDL